MSRIHDMGGRLGYGAVVPEPEGHPFHEAWHPRALALTLAAGALGAWNLDMTRRTREALAPADYVAFSYYEIWLAALANLLDETGLVSRAELADGHADGPSPLADRRLSAEAVAPALRKGGPTERDVAASPRFSPGMRVRARRPADSRLVRGGHTRLPAYAAGAEGRILACHGAHVLPDAHAHGLGERPEPLYAVAFAARDLWPEAAEGDDVIADLWQSYLEPV